MQQAKSQNTKQALISAAQRLFAEKGLAGVSVREITRAAGARNESALHYHFGDIETLIREVFAHRYRQIEEARLSRLAQIEAAGQSEDLPALLQAAIGPLFEACHDEDGRLYARFCVQLVTDPRFDLLPLVRDLGAEGILALGQHLRNCLSALPTDILEMRLRRLFTLSILLMADHAAQVEAGSASAPGVAISEAAASLAGFLSAPTAVTPPVPQRKTIGYPDDSTRDRADDAFMEGH